jgi:hypothetical protein
MATIRWNRSCRPLYAATLYGASRSLSPFSPVTMRVSQDLEAAGNIRFAPELTS